MAMGFPGLHEHRLTDGITWNFYKHWGQSYLAGERIEQVNGDHSGGEKFINGMRLTNAPIVVQAREYTSERGSISAVYSYPNGLGVCDHYFWEIWDSALMDDIERFDTEEEMEQRIIELLSPER